jgi:predicted nucleic acid-binding protein
MGWLVERLRTISVLGLDTAIFIYHFEENATYLPQTRELFSSIEQGEHRAVTSTITLMEVAVRPFVLQRIDVARKYEALLVNFPNLDIVVLDRDVIRLAARLRANYRIRPPDALHISANLLRGAGAFITNDISLKRLQDQIDVIILDDFVVDQTKK